MFGDKMMYLDILIIHVHVISIEVLLLQVSIKLLNSN